jgi:multicomponent Na+:H+ antiporter subunit E
MPATGGNSPVRIAVARGAGLFVLWIVLIRSVQPADLAVGALTVAVATWVSLRLLPPDAGRVNFGALAARLPRFLWQSVRAGFDVARRAFDPRLPLAPGFVTYRPGCPRGLARNTFATITSLLPGTVPVADDADGIIYHCLDTAQPVLEELATEEREYAPALVAGRPLA